MFGGLKKKLKGALSVFSRKVEKEVEEAPKEEVKEDKPKKEKVKEIKIPEKFETGKLQFEPDVEEIKKVEEKLVEEEAEEEVKEGPKEEIVEEPKKKGFFGRVKEGIITKKISEGKFDDLFNDLEMDLLESNVALEVVEKIKEDLRKELVDNFIKRSDVSGIVFETLKKSVDELLSVESIDIISNAKKKKPYVICFLGINGTGKSTTIGKFAYMLQKNGLSCTMAAADTFRAAAIEQLGELAKKTDVKMIAHEYGSDPAAVAYDAVEHAKAKNLNCVLIDTAGRLHSNKNLMAELHKIIKVAKPDLKIFVGESITGNDCIEQAVEFNEAVGIDGVILSKTDVDDKGGTAVSISYVTKKPILYIGTGQGLDDLELFDKSKVMESLGL